LLIPEIAGLARVYFAFSFESWHGDADEVSGEALAPDVRVNAIAPGNDYDGGDPPEWAANS